MPPWRWTHDFAAANRGKYASHASCLHRGCRFPEAGTIDAKRAQELKRAFQLKLIEADVRAQPLAWQIEMLQEIAGVLQNPTCIERLMSAQDLEEVRAALSKVHA